VSNNNKAVINDPKPSNTVSSSTSPDAAKPLGVKLDCKTIIFEEKFHCKAQALFDCFARQELMQAFTRGDVTLDFKKGGE